MTSSMVALAAAERVGVALLFYRLRALPMRKSLRVPWNILLRLTAADQFQPGYFCTTPLDL